MAIRSIVYSNNSDLEARICYCESQNWLITFIKNKKELGFTIRRSLTSAQSVCRAYCDSGELNEKDKFLVRSGR